MDTLCQILTRRGLERGAVSGYTRYSIPDGRSSSVVERIIGNDEVESSILSCGTSHPLYFRPPFMPLPGISAIGAQRNGSDENI